MKILHFNCDHCHQVLEINYEDFKEEFRNEEHAWGEMVECPQCNNQTTCIVKNSDVFDIDIDLDFNQESPPYIEQLPVSFKNPDFTSNINTQMSDKKGLGFWEVVFAIVLALCIFALCG